MNPEPTRHEKLLAQIRKTYSEASDDAETMRGEGMDVDVLLAACEELIAVLEGRAAGGEPEIVALVARVNAAVEEMKEFYDLQDQAESVRKQTSIDVKLAAAAQMSGRLRAHGGEKEKREAVLLEEHLARMRQLLAANRQSQDDRDDALLMIQEEKAKLMRRQNYYGAACGLYREQWSPERWAQLSPEKRAENEALLAKWRAAREEILGSLPIEDRRRLEKMRGEDFQKPGAFEP